MRKFLIRWWYGPNWQKDLEARMRVNFGTDPALNAIRLQWLRTSEEYRIYLGDWQHNDPPNSPISLEVKCFSHRPLTFSEYAVSRAIQEAGLVVYPDGSLQDSEGYKLVFQNK